MDFKKDNLDATINDIDRIPSYLNTISDKQPRVKSAFAAGRRTLSRRTRNAPGS